MFAQQRETVFEGYTWTLWKRMRKVHYELDGQNKKAEQTLKIPLDSKKKLKNEAD